MRVPTPLVDTKHFLAHLPRGPLNSFLNVCNVVELHAQEELNTAGQKINFVYFPIDSLIALIMTVDGKSIETGLIGNEGMLGTAVFLGAEEAACSAYVQMSGKAYQLSTAAFMDQLDKSEALRSLMSRYILVLMDRLSISVGCHHFHSIEKRLAYLLLMINEGINSSHINITQAAMSNILGVRRSGISGAANLLHQKNIIQYSRGRIDILDKGGLEAESCSCYQATKKSYQWIKPRQ